MLLSLQTESLAKNGATPKQLLSLEKAFFSPKRVKIKYKNKNKYVFSTYIETI